MSLNHSLRVQINVSRVECEQERSAAGAMSNSEIAYKGFPCSKLCKIFEQRKEEKADIWIKNC